MAQKKTKSKAKSRSRSKVVSSKGNSLQRLVAFLRKKPVLLLVLFLSGAIGVYLLVDSYAKAQDEILLPDDPARGLIYKGKKVKTSGPCEGAFDLTTPEDTELHGKEAKRCGHLDPAPEGVDIRERVKKVDAELEELKKHDEKIKPNQSGSTEAEALVAATVTQYNMSGIAAMNVPCLGDGKANERVQAIYVYSSNRANRLSDLRPGFNAIARRVNNIFFQSGAESGNGHQIRFATNNGNPGCTLAMTAEPIRADEMDNFSFIRSKLRERGYTGPDRKYLVWVDSDSAGLCGLGEVMPDYRADYTKNMNNTTSAMYAMVWKGCWNYAEPHEIMHNLGAVQSGRSLITPDSTQPAPYSTPGMHCRDERDIMCYEDDRVKDGQVDGKPMRTFCTRDIDYWRFDCNHDTYYRGNDPASGWLSSHWNTANSRFLAR